MSLPQHAGSDLSHSEAPRWCAGPSRSLSRQNPLRFPLELLAELHQFYLQYECPARSAELVSCGHGDGVTPAAADGRDPCDGGYAFSGVPEF